MKLRKMLGAICALAVTASAFAGFGVTADAAETPVTYECSQSASGQSDTQTLVLNLKDSQEKQNVTFNNNSGTWKGVALLEFEIPATDPSKVVSAQLDVSLHNMGTRGGTRTYTVNKSNGITLSESTTYSDVLNTNGDVLYTGAGLYDGSYRNDSITGQSITDYVKGLLNANETSTVQFAFTTAAQMFEIYTAPDATVEQIVTAAPKLTLTISDTEVVNRNITINYIDEDGTPFRSPGNDTIVDGETYTPEYDTIITQDGYKYTYISGGDPVVVSGQDAIINLVYSKAPLANTKITLNAAYGEKTALISQIDAVELTNYSLPYSKYILDGSTVYSIESQANGSAYFAYAATGEQDDQVLTVKYAQSATDGVYFVEAEDITGESTNVNNAGVRCSNGLCYRIPAEGIDVVTLSPGTYTIETAAWGTAGDTYTITAGTNNVEVTTTGSVATAKSEAFTLTEDTVVRVSGETSHGTGLDYILITGTGSVAPSIDLMHTTAQAVELTNQQITSADGGETTTVSGTAYTIWYKLTNFAEGTQPTITLKGIAGTVNETATITQAEVGTDGYYCVQILDDENLEAGSYTVTLTAGDVTSEAVTFTAK